MPEMDNRLEERHTKWLETIKGACDRGGVYLLEGGYPISPVVFSIDRDIYSDDERAALADLIRWGYCEWGAGFIAGDLGCRITRTGRDQLMVRGSDAE